MPDATTCENWGSAQRATPSGAGGRAKNHWPPFALAPKRSSFLFQTWKVGSRVSKRTPSLAKFQWSPFFQIDDANDVPAVPFQSIGFCGSFVHSTRNGSDGSAARAIAIVGGSPVTPPPGFFPSTTSYKMTTSSPRTVTDPSQLPRASYHCVASDAFGRSGGGNRVQWTRSSETTWSQ